MNIDYEMAETIYKLTASNRTTEKEFCIMARYLEKENVDAAEYLKFLIRRHGTCLRKPCFKMSSARFISLHNLISF